MSSAPGAPSGWPVVGRDAEVDALVERLGDLQTRAQILTGPPGIGKTVLAGRVADRMPERTVVSVIGLSELAAVPLGAFAPALAALDLPLDPAAAVPALVARVGRAPADHLLLVDDAPRLDEVSAAAIYQLVRGFGVPMIATARLGEPLPGPLAKLVLEGFADERPVEGLGLEDIQDLLRRRFGATGRRSDAARLATRTEGNPLYLRMLVETAVREGSVREAGGVVEIDDGQTPTGLLSSIDAAISSLPQHERDALRFVSLTQPLDMTAAAGLVPWPRAVFDSLASRGAIVRQGGSRAVRVAHPLVSEVLAASGDTDAVIGDAVAYLRSLGDPSSRFAAVVVQSAHELGATGADLVWAADHAFRAGDFEHAVMLAEKGAVAAASDPALTFRANLILGSARSSMGDLDGADAAFDDAFEMVSKVTRGADARTGSGTDPDVGLPTWTDRALLASRRGAHLAFRRFDVPAAIAAAEAVRSAAPPAVAATLDPELRLWRGLLGQMHEREGRTEGADESPEMLVRGAVVSIMTESMNGRTAAAVEAASQLSDAQSRFGVLDPFAAAIIGIETYFDLLSRGDDHERAVDFAERRRADTGEAAGIWTTTVAEHRSYNGRLREARRLCALAVDQLEWRDPFAILPLALAIRADLAAKSGDHAGARELVAAMAPAQRAEPKALMMIAECDAWLAAAEGDPDRASRIIEHAAEQAVGVGFHLVAAISLGVSIRVGRVDRAAGLLEAICEDVPSDLRLYTALRDVAVSLRDRDPGRMPVAASALVSAGMAPTALDALALARRMRPDAETQHRLDRVALVAARDVDAPLLQYREAPLISPREREVALAAAGRERSREIAERFGVSPRTIDNQLQSVYRKLGVSSRDELREALRETGLLETGFVATGSPETGLVGTGAVSTALHDTAAG